MLFKFSLIVLASVVVQTESCDPVTIVFRLSSEA